MIKFNQQSLETVVAPEEATGDEQIAPVPRISVQAFCESVETAGAMQGAAEDRRMAKAHVRIQMGGMPAALEAYRASPTPNIIVIESEKPGDALLEALDELSNVCDPETRVIVVGKLNDIV